MKNIISLLIISNLILLCCSIISRVPYRIINPIGTQVAKYGYNCLDKFSDFYFTRDTEKLTRAKNTVITYSVNMSLPAAEIEQLFLEHINDDLNKNIDKKNDLYSTYQIRVISDGKKLSKLSLRDSFDQIVDFYAIVTDSYERFSNLFVKYITKSSSWNPDAKFLILYHSHNKSDDGISMKIFKLIYENDVSHSVIFYATNVTYYKILYMDLFRQETCRKITNSTIREIGGCNKGNIVNYYELRTYLNASSTSFKLTNCTFTLCPKEAEPFVENNCSTGIELTIVEGIKNKLGFELETLCMDERGVLENDIWTGILGQLKAKQCDFSVGGFYPDDEYVNNFWGSTPYLLDQHTWFVFLAPMRAPWKGIIMIFDEHLWVACLGIFILTWLMWFFFGKTTLENKLHESVSLTGINTLALILGISVDARPRFQPLRVFFLFTSIFGLIITTIYTSKLIAVFSNPAKDYQINEINEVIEMKIPFGGPLEKQDWFNTSGENTQDLYILNHYNASSKFSDNLENLEYVKNKQQVMLLNRMYVLQSNYSSYIYGFPKDVFSSQVQMIFNRGFPLRIQFDIVIRDYLEFGLIQKLQNELLFNNTELKKLGKTHDDSAHSLTPYHMSGAFASLALGSIASLLAFLGELLSKYYLNDWINKHFGVKNNLCDSKKKNYSNRKLHPIRFTPNLKRVNNERNKKK